MVIIEKNHRDSMQMQVERYLMEKIETGAWPISYKIPSERTLATDLDVSRITVRNALLSLTARGIFERSSGKGTFVKRGIRMNSEVNGSVTGSIGYVICKEKASRKPISTEVFYFDVFSGIEEVTAESGRHVLFMYLDDFDRNELASFHTFLEKVDGLVIEEARNLSFLRDIRESGVPTVLLAPTVSIEGIDLIAMDLAEGVRKAVRYLHSLGHARIAIINGPMHLDSAKIRYEAWERTFEELGLPVERDLVAGGDGWTVETGFTGMQALLERDAGFTAVLRANDLIAIGALSALSQAQRSIPRDVSIMGFDDTELARLASPPLTSMKIYSRDMAHSAARRLIERIGHHSLLPIRIEYPIDLVERQSCGKPNDTPRQDTGD